MSRFLSLPLFVLVFFIHNTFFAQSSDPIFLKQQYESRFEHYRESIHLHLNKTTFLKGDEIWWSAYAYNKKSGTPSNPTKNLYCGIYDSEGQLVQRALFLMEKGLAHGSFKIDSKWRPGSYYIKAGTQWMENFEEDHPFIQKIEIIEDYPSDEDFTAEKNYDVQILPEGGHLILGVENMVGVRIVDQNGKGVAVENGTIYDSENKVVADVYTNEAGVGRFRLIPGKGISYHLKLEVDVDKVVNTELPNAKPIGITMAVNNILEDKLVISVNTNQETLDQLDQNTFHLAVHRDGIMTLNSFVMDSTTRSIKISKKNVLPGTNIITLFDQELEPISARLIFNFQRAKIANAQISKLSSGKDSVSLKIQTSAKKAVPIAMSVSALPTASTSNQTNINIISSLLLEPYM